MKAIEALQIANCQLQIVNWGGLVGRGGGL